MKEQWIASESEPTNFDYINRIHRHLQRCGGCADNHYIIDILPENEAIPKTGFQTICNDCENVVEIKRRPKTPAKAPVKQPIMFRQRKFVNTVHMPF
jgi:hypothetical protein